MAATFDENDQLAAIALSSNDTIDIWCIFDLCIKDLERNSVPSYIQIVEEIPKTVSEKNLGRLLKEVFTPDDPNGYAFASFQ